MRRKRIFGFTFIRNGKSETFKIQGMYVMFDLNMLNREYMNISFDTTET